MKLGTVISGVAFCGVLVVGGVLVHNDSHKDIKEVHSKIEQPKKIKEVKPEVNVENEKPKEQVKHESIEKESLENKKEIKQIKKIDTEDMSIKPKVSTRTKAVKKENKPEVKPETTNKEEVKEVEEETSSKCYYCEHADEIDTYGMGSKFVYDNFKVLSDDEIRDKVNELPSSVCDVHKLNVKDGVEHALHLLHDSETQNTSNGGEHK